MGYIKIDTITYGDFPKPTIPTNSFEVDTSGPPESAWIDEKEVEFPNTFQKNSKPNHSQSKLLRQL